MPNDIFNRTTDVWGGAFAADQATLTFPNVRSADGTNVGAQLGLLTQNLQAQYTQQVTRLYEIGSPRIYYVGGRTAGQGTLARVVGPALISRAFYRTYGDVCRAKTNTIQIEMTTDCSSADVTGNFQGRAAYTAKFVVITMVGLNIAAQDMLINEQVQYMFSSFDYNDGSAG